MRKKIKKVIKGLEKASKTHAKQAKVLKSGLKVFKAKGGMDASKADLTARIKFSIEQKLTMGNLCYNIT